MDIKNKKLFSAKDLCDIMRTCSVTKVSVFQYEDIRIEFNYHATPTASTDQRQFTHPPVEEPVDQDSTIEISREELLEMEEDDLLLSDPFAYEQRQLMRQTGSDS